MSSPRWFRIVSTRIAVLPVPRSPMISSRWPRPIGIIESIAFRPVWSGCLTGWRSNTPGALNSLGRVSVVSLGPWPSRGWPSGVRDRPVEAAAHARVEAQRAGLEDDAADQVGVDGVGRLHLAARSFLDLLDHVTPLLFGEVDGGCHLDIEDSLFLGHQALELAGDLVDLAGAVLLGEQEQKVADELLVAAEELLEHRGLDTLVELGIPEQVAQLGNLALRLDEVAELLAHRVEPVCILGRGVEGARVRAVGDGH